MLNKPNKTKYGVFHNIIKPVVFKTENKFVKFNNALISTENSILTASQLNAAILYIKRKLKDNTNLLVRVFPHIGVSKRPLEMPLGRGKASISYWATTIKSGSIIFELKTDQKFLINSVLKGAGGKLPFKTRVVNQKLV